MYFVLKKKYKTEICEKIRCNRFLGKRKFFGLCKSDVAVEYWERTLRQLKHEYPELADIAKTAEKIILFENEDKSCLYQDESEDLKKRIIFSIQKNVKI